MLALNECSLAGEIGARPQKTEPQVGSNRYPKRSTNKMPESLSKENDQGRKNVCLGRRKLDAGETFWIVSQGSGWAVGHPRAALFLVV